MKTNIKTEELLALDKAIFGLGLDRSTHDIDRNTIIIEDTYLCVTVNPIRNLPIEEGKSLFPSIITWCRDSFEIINELKIGKNFQTKLRDGIFEILQIEKSGKGLFVLCRVPYNDSLPKVYGEVVQTQLLVFDYAKGILTGVSEIYHYDNEDINGLSLDGKLYVDQITNNRYLIRYVMRDRSQNTMFYFNKSTSEPFMSFPSTYIPDRIIEIIENNNRLNILFEGSYEYCCACYILKREFKSWKEQATIKISHQDLGGSERKNLTIKEFFRKQKSIFAAFVKISRSKKL